MRVTGMRRLVKNQPLMGIPVAGIFLLTRFLWMHRKAAFFRLTLVAATTFLLPMVFYRKDPPVSSVQTSARKPVYSVTDLGTLGNFSDSVATDINNKSQIVGWCGVQGQVTHAFLWQNGRMTDLGTPRGSRSKALALNDKGQIVGWSGDDEKKHCTAYLWKNGKARALGTLPARKSSIAAGINVSGDICGWAFGAKEGKYGGTDGFLLSKGKMTAIPNDLEEIEAYAINDKKQVVGFIQFIDIFYAFVYQDGKRRDLPFPIGAEPVANAINNKGAVVGMCCWRWDFRACLWGRGADGVVIDLGTLGGSSVAKDINDREQIVGSSSVVSGNRPEAQRAFLWQKGRMQNLQYCIPSNSGWILSSANAVNNKGEIVGTGIIDGKTHAFLLTPQ